MGSCAALKGVADDSGEKKKKITKQSAKTKKATGSKKVKKKRTKLTKKQKHDIIVEHQEHGKRLAWSFLSSWRIRLAQDEVTSVVGAALCEAASRFDPSKEVAFKTFFFYHLRGMLLKEIAQVINEQKILQLIPSTFIADAYRADEMVPVNWSRALMEHNNPERIVEKKEVAGACWEACSQLDPLEQEVLIRHFVYDEQLIHIAKELKYCRCHISRVKSRALSKLGKLLKSSAVLKERVEESSEESLADMRFTKPGAGPASAKNYTGGRGRRKNKAAVQRSEVLTKMLEEVYSS